MVLCQHNLMNLVWWKNTDNDFVVSLEIKNFTPPHNFIYFSKKSPLLMQFFDYTWPFFQRQKREVSCFKGKVTLTKCFHVNIVAFKRACLFPLQRDSSMPWPLQRVLTFLLHQHYYYTMPLIFPYWIPAIPYSSFLSLRRKLRLQCTRRIFY